MYSSETISSMSREAAIKAAEEGNTPFMVWPEDLEQVPPFPFPFIGDYIAPGWKRTGEQFFVDSSGLGLPCEPALTTQEFLDKIKVGYGYALVEVGQFQVKVAEYEREEA